MKVNLSSSDSGKSVVVPHRMNSQSTSSSKTASAEIPLQSQLPGSGVAVVLQWCFSGPLFYHCTHNKQLNGLQWYFSGKSVVNQPQLLRQLQLL